MGPFDRKTDTDKGGRRGPEARQRPSHQRRRLREKAEELGAGGRGRAWINGREVDGADPRWAHLAASHD